MTTTRILAVSLAGLALSLVPTRDTPRHAPLTREALAADSITVVLLGTAVGPTVNLQQYGASIFVNAGGERLLFDCGRGATMRLTQIGVPIGAINQVFLTHLHSDHIIQLPDLILTGWAGGRRTTPLHVWGPKGTRRMIDHLQQAFAFDIETRRDKDEKLPSAGIRVESHDVSEGVVYARNGVTVTAFLVNHFDDGPAIGYRVDYQGRSVAMSGDTRFSENLIRVTKGVDVLIHEAIDADALRKRADLPNPNAIESIIALHTTPEQAAEVFNRVKPRLAVYSHAPNTESLIAQTRKTYAGPLLGPEDLLTIVIGDSIQIRRFTGVR